MVFRPGGLPIRPTEVVCKRVLKGEIGQELQYLTQMVDVNSASILVPYPPSRDTRFAFLSVLGTGANKSKMFF